MSDDTGQPAPLHWQDAFSSPSWQIPQLDEAVLAPPLEDFGLTDFRAPRDLPKPPDVDEILRGEYTGWIPVIRPGESLAQAEEREQELVTQLEDVNVADTAQAAEAIVPLAPLESLETSASDDHTPLVHDSTSRSPWLAVETFEYGLQAQHEVPSPPEPTRVVEPSAYVQPVPVEEPTPVISPNVNVQPAPISEPAPVVQPAAQAQPQSVLEEPSVHADAFNDTFDTSTWDSSDSAAGQHAPQPTQSIDATFIAEPAAQTDHSLELVIMRDEIQDLRNRLDASQKLVEEMMHKLANLAELALRSRM